MHPSCQTLGAKMVTPVIVALLVTLSCGAKAELCKYIDSAGNAHYQSTPPETTWRLIECYGRDATSAPKPTSHQAVLGVGPPSILPHCLDSGPATIGVGPSARARECTRQYCARPEYRARVTAYATNQRQSETDRAEALICITRSEQDLGRK